MKTIRIMSASILLLATACSKRESNADPSMTVKNASSIKDEYAVSTPPTSANDPAANLLNPVDSVGRIHNEALEYAWQRTVISNASQPNTASRQVASFFMARYGKNHLAIHLPVSQPSAWIQSDSLTKQTLGKYFKPAVAAYIQRILEAFSLAQASSDYPKVKARIVDLEQQISADRVLSSVEKQKLFLVTSIARYSTWYWLQKAALPPTTGSMHTMGIFHKIIRAINIALADTAATAEGIWNLDSVSDILENASVCSAMAGMGS